ncbi:MAG: bifunctional 3'-5' exonuclease/DNA polymerase [Eubacteriales bacterium]|nr:bifunctional 3'-5' exonuclease/DNA polymerase [Eubacteriales bacterium]
MESNYICVTTLDGIRNYIAGATDVAFDFETSPNDEYRDDEKAALDPAKSHIVGCSFSVKEYTGIYVPVDHKVGTNIDKAEFLAFLREFLMDKSIRKIAHNLSFEAMFSYYLGIVILPPVYDTIAASQMSLKSSTEFRGLSDSGLKKLATELCHEAIPTFTDVTGGKHFDELDAQDTEAVRYGAADSDYSLRLMHIFNSWFERFLPKHKWIVENIESPTAVYLGIMKCNGVPINLPLMLQRKEEAENAMEQLRGQIALIIGDVKIGSNCSTKAFKDYLYQTLNLPVLKTTNTDKEAADDATMTLLKEWCDENRKELSPLFALVQEYRKWGKIKSTYIDGYLKYLNSATGKIHPNMYALSTDTGRFNCNHPNCQNMPRKTNDPIGVRNFIAAPEGYLIVSCDYSQIELRVGAHYCQDEIMMETYRTGGDIHAATTSVVFGCSYSEALDKHHPLYKERRTIAKNVNFGTFYGLFPRGLQTTLKFKAGVVKSALECETIIANLKEGYPKLVTWQEETKTGAAKRMYCETRLGRRRYLPDINSTDWGKKSFAERQSMNTPIQGTAADILKLALGRILLGLPDRPWLQPILQIHDELTFIIPKERLDEAVSYIKECMQPQPFPEFDLPLVAESSVGSTFGTMEELEET